jgi:hypothetical protein
MSYSDIISDGGMDPRNRPGSAEYHEPEKKHAFVMWGEYETRIEALTKEVNFHKSLSAKAALSPPVTQEITRLKSIIEDMELKLDAAQSAQPAVQEPQPKRLTDEQIEALLPVIQLKGEAPKQAVWLTKKDALHFARAIESAHGIKE